MPASEGPPGPRADLAPSLLVGYRDQMQRRVAERAPRARQRRRARAFWIACGLLAALTAWRWVVYAVDLTRYLSLSVAGVTTQATVLRKQTEGGLSADRPDHFIVTYGFWAGGSGVIRREKVRPGTFDALAVEGPVAVVYRPARPEGARIARELSFPWSPDAIGLLVACILLATVGRRAALGRHGARLPPEPVPPNPVGE